MKDQPLGRLSKVSLRRYWQREDTEFTPWLATQENIELLAEAIGLDLEVQAQEAHVGAFRADIICRNTADGSVVLIENQLERTDHSHLGQLLVYAAGLNAVTLVWVVERFTEEHRAALDWLNRITDEGFYFFGLEVELWRIGESPPAPKFNVVAKPNDWSRTVREIASSGSYTETDRIKADFWAQFAAYLEGLGQQDRLPLAKPMNWQGWGVGRSGFLLCATINVRDGHVGVFLNLSGPDAEAHFQLLRQERAEIERELGHPLEWKVAEKERKLILRRQSDTSDPANWSELHEWLHSTMLKFRRVFEARVRRLDATNWEPAEAEGVVVVDEART